MTQAVMTQEQKILEPKSEFSSHERGDSRWTHARGQNQELGFRLGGLFNLYLLRDRIGRGLMG